MKRTTHTALRLGFLPENDCAPAVVAHEFGLFSQHGLKVELQREASCAGLRDHLLQGSLDAALAPATLPFVLSLGLDFEQCHCVSSLVTSLQGNALALSRRLWDAGVRDAATLRERVFQDWGRRTYTFGVVFPYSPQYFLLCQWLRAARLVPHSHVRIVVMSPEQMYPTMELGYLDGFCVGEPWSTVAVEAGVAVRVTTSAQMSPRHPEKVLMVRESLAARRAETHERLIAALVEAGRICDHGEKSEEVCELLAQPQYVNAPAECIRAGLFGPTDSVDGSNKPAPRLNRLSGPHTHDPSPDKAAWITRHLWDFLHLDPAQAAGVRRSDFIFRREPYRNAMQRLPRTAAARPVARELVAAGNEYAMA